MASPVGFNLTSVQSISGYFVTVVSDTAYMAAILNRFLIFKSGYLPGYARYKQEVFRKTFVCPQAYHPIFGRSQHAPYKYSNFPANRYCKYLSFLKSQGQGVGGGGGGGGNSVFQVTGMIEWEQKSRPKKIPRGFQQNPKKSLDQKIEKRINCKADTT